MHTARADLSGKRVLVTGGTGFIGGRLVERLVTECQANVRVLVRNLTKAFRIARFPIEIVHGDVTQISDVHRAARKCDVVLHCAYGNQGDAEQQQLVNAKGTENVLEAALHARAKRIVHLSTVAVYGWKTRDGDLDETAPKQYSGNTYSDSKLDAEKIALFYAKNHSLPVVVLQPTVVYGPFGSPWTVNVVNQLKTGKIILVNGGDGFCNAVYVDDVVSAIILAAVKDTAAGNVFLISGEKPIAWRTYYAGYESILGESSTVSMSQTEAISYYGNLLKSERRKSILKEALSILREDHHMRSRIRNTSEIAKLVKIGRLFLPSSLRHSFRERIANVDKTHQSHTHPEDGKAIHELPPLMVRFFAAKTRVRIDKAKRVLDYQPAFDFQSGMRLTQSWLEWANLI